ncbi:hypothetical protein ACFE04_001856 [Oxalis oulophora]
MGFTTTNSLVCCCILVFFVTIKTGQADFRCYGTGNFTANSTYSNNRDTIIASLATNAAANGGFYNSSVGQGSDTVYATAMCSGDMNSTECSSCVNTTAYVLLTDCPLQYEAVSWDETPVCVVHYANKYIFGVLELDPIHIGYNTGKISWNSFGFEETWTHFVQSLKNEAASGTSRLKYAAKKQIFSVTTDIYAQVQCTPDLSMSDCDQCLTQNLADYKSYCYGYKGGVVRRPNCVFRWDMYPFFKIVNNASPPSPPPSSPHSRLSSTGNGALSSEKIAIIVGSVTFFVALVAVGLPLFRYQRKSRARTTQQFIRKYIRP